MNVGTMLTLAKQAAADLAAIRQLLSELVEEARRRG